MASLTRGSTWRSFALLKWACVSGFNFCLLFLFQPLIWMVKPSLFTESHSAPGQISVIRFDLIPVLLQEWSSFIPPQMKDFTFFPHSCFKRHYVQFILQCNSVISALMETDLTPAQLQLNKYSIINLLFGRWMSDACGLKNAV